MAFIKANKLPLGIAACVVLVVGCFVPLFSALNVLTENYYKDGEGDGIILIILTGISVALLVTNRYRGLLVSAILSAVLILYDFFDVLSTDLIDLEWGWLLLFAGVILLLAVAVVGYLETRAGEPSPAPADEESPPPQ
jgi:hypothetical protein